MSKHIDLSLIKKMTAAKVTNAPKLSKSSMKTMKCSTARCERVVPVDNETTSVVCHVCTTQMVGVTTPTVSNKYTVEERKERKALIAKKKADKRAYQEKYKDFPKGWWLKSTYTHSDGRKFQRGKEVKKFTIKEKSVKEKSDMPRGWHLRKKFVHKGIKYSFGKAMK